MFYFCIGYANVHVYFLVLALIKYLMPCNNTTYLQRSIRMMRVVIVSRKRTYRQNSYSTWFHLWSFGTQLSERYIRQEFSAKFEVVLSSAAPSLFSL